MKTTIRDLRARVAALEAELNRLNRNARDAMVINKIRELNGAETNISTPADFAHILCDIHEHVVEIARLKGIVNTLNSTTKLSTGKSIMETIALLNGLRQERNILSNAMDIKEITRRRADGGLSTSPAYYEITSPNFDHATVESQYKELTENINTLEAEINRLNAQEIEIDD